MQTPFTASLPLQPGCLPIETGRAPGHLLVLVCDAALRRLRSAEAGLLAGTWGDACADIEHAQRILLEMMGALDRAVAPGMTDALANLYQQVFDRLTDAIRERDAAIVAEVRTILTSLRDAWSDASHTVRFPLWR